jgi:ribosomal protein S18 acetylase RimI-like enzyme
MAEIEYHPPLARPLPQPCLQRIELREADFTIATARWHVPLGKEGVAQLLDLAVVPEHRRKGHGSTLMKALIAEAAAYGAASGTPMRRIWVSVEQKTQINARAFLTRHGFHHVATIKELLASQDALVYLLSLD